MYGNGLGAIVRIENSSYLIENYNSGIRIQPGYNTFIDVDRLFEFNMAKPYSNCDIDNHSPEIIDSDLYRLIDESPYEYTKKFCLEQCIQTLLIQKCSCSDYKRGSVLYWYHTLRTFPLTSWIIARVHWNVIPLNINIFNLQIK